MLGIGLLLMGCGLDPAPLDSVVDTGPESACVPRAFANRAVDWALPPDALGSLRLPVDPNPLDNNWALLSLEGGGPLELVYAWPGGALGWAVHANTGQGFALESSTWVVPGSLLSHLSQIEDQDGQGLDWQLQDTDGDGQEDLVITQLPGSDELGQSYWLVYRGQEGGFADTATRYDLPLAIRGSDYFLLDQQGDGVPDLWIELGAGWQVHLGQEQGFSDSSFELRAPGGTTEKGSGELRDLNGDGYPDWYAGQELAWGGEAGFGPLQELDLPAHAQPFVLDLNGDGHYQVIDARSEPQAWLLYSLEPSTLGLQVGALELPDGYLDSSFEWAQQIQGRVWYGLRELTGDGVLDLVVTRIQDQESVGVEHWRVHAGICDLN